MTMLDNPSGGALRGACILVVEDEWMVSALLVDLLQGFGCEVVGPAARIAMAIDLAATQKIDCGLLDLNVAGELVYPVAQALSDRGIPFVFTTGYRKTQILENFRDRPLLRKPYRPQELMQILADLVNTSKPGAEAGKSTSSPA
jgi:CheY-like chemotaxis protein